MAQTYVEPKQRQQGGPQVEGPIPVSSWSVLDTEGVGPAMNSRPGSTVAPSGSPSALLAVEARTCMAMSGPSVYRWVLSPPWIWQACADMQDDADSFTLVDAPAAGFSGCIATNAAFLSLANARNRRAKKLLDLPTELLLEILAYLDVSDLLSASRTSHHLRALSVAPFLHQLRLRRTRAALIPMLSSPTRPSLAELMSRRIFITNTTAVSRQLGRNLAAICLSRRLAVRPSAEALVARCVLPPECLPGARHKLAPALVQKARAIERERLKDVLRRWLGAVWKGEVRERAEDVRRVEEKMGVGRVWRLTRFWERVGKGQMPIGL